MGGIAPFPLCTPVQWFHGTSRLCFWGSRSAAPNRATQTRDTMTAGSPSPARQTPPPPIAPVTSTLRMLRFGVCLQTGLVCHETNLAAPLPGSAL